MRTTCFYSHKMKRILAILFLVSGLAVQLSAQKTIAFKATNESLGSVLLRLAATNTVNLTYNPADPALETKVNYATTAKNPTEILNDILSQTKRDFKQVGNHFVIVHSNEKPSQTPVKKQETAVSKAPVQAVESYPAAVLRQAENIILPDTIVVNDTIVRIDTVVVIQEKIVVDTVYIRESVEQQMRGQRSLNLSRNVFRFEANRQDGWAFAIHYDQLLAGMLPQNEIVPTPELEPVKASESLSLRNFGLGLSARYNKGRLSVETGLSLNVFNNRFRYTELIETGGFFRLDTLDTYFTIIQNDTNYFYVTDSTYIPLDRSETIYDRNNRISILEISAGLQYILLNTGDFNFYFSGGLGLALPIWVKGNIIVNETGYPVQDFDKNNVAQSMLSWRTGLGVRFQLSNFVDLYAEPYYKRYMNEPTPLHPLSRRLQGGGLRFGMIYYL